MDGIGSGHGKWKMDPRTTPDERPDVKKGEHVRRNVIIDLSTLVWRSHEFMILITVSPGQDIGPHHSPSLILRRFWTLAVQYSDNKSVSSSCEGLSSLFHFSLVVSALSTLRLVVWRPWLLCALELRTISVSIIDFLLCATCRVRYSVRVSFERRL